ncbi:hypothetical protein LEP1GSC170_2373 [Leptospira interrogans serovar Bataviae str. HAI135]|nr:hypothetical protein LEP1GSC170_2373 [Leptospira interrogans serovar Bataviae str. HAI135]
MASFLKSGDFQVDSFIWRNDSFLVPVRLAQFWRSCRTN